MGTEEWDKMMEILIFSFVIYFPVFEALKHDYSTSVK